MKCPYCGAEVTPNTKCEYCGSFVERPPQKQAHTNFHNQQNPNMNSQTGKTSQTAAPKKTDNSSVFKTLKPIIITFFIFTFGLPLATLFITGISTLFIALATGGFSLSLSTHDDKPDLSEIYSLSYVEGTVKNYHDDGSITIEYDYDDYNTELADQEFIDWLEETNRSIDGYEVIFSTDSEGCITVIAMPSDTFYVFDQSDDTYVLIRGDSVFRAKSNVELEIGTFYTGYISYPNTTVQQASYESDYPYSLFDPYCVKKEISTVKDEYSGEDLLIPAVCFDNQWYYCSQELYDKCQVGETVSEDLSHSYDIKIAYAD